MPLIAITEMIAAAMLIGAAPPATATTQGRTTTEAYRARYDARRDVYCIRFFADPPAADPRPGPSRDTCQSRTAWAKEGVAIDRVPRSAPS